MACVLFLVAAAGIAIYLANVAKDLPDYAVLNSYAPPVTTRVHESRNTSLVRSNAGI